MIKISQILRETNIQQIQNAYIRFIDGELEGKCALGVLACESGVADLKLGRDNVSVNSTDILEAYDIKDILITQLLFGSKNYDIDINWDFGCEIHRISDVIVILNDRYDYTFEEIADFLEVTFDL